ncbi:MAG TPA: hypothetical protein VGL46_18530 [Pseudonocardiaceae bacterium]|jgi:hypothetical protein
MATSRPSRVAPTRTRCIVSGRWPTDVNIYGRVTTSLTGRPTTQAASAVDHVRPGAESGPEPASQVRNKNPDVSLR